MWSMYDHMGGAVALYGLIWLAVVAIGLTALWRGMKAHEAIATHLEGIARSLGQPREPPK